PNTSALASLLANIRASPFAEDSEGKFRGEHSRSSRGEGHLVIASRGRNWANFALSQSRNMSPRCGHQATKSGIFRGVDHLVIPPSPQVNDMKGAPTNSRSLIVQQKQKPRTMPGFWLCVRQLSPTLPGAIIDAQLHGVGRQAVLIGKHAAPREGRSL